MTKERLPTSSLHRSGGVSLLQQSISTPAPRCDGPEAAFAAQLGQIAHQALLVEAELTPKPGLVDAANDGAHRDMSLVTFHASAKALRPYLNAFVLAGINAGNEPATEALAPLRALGLDAERAMLAATRHVNTHKGAIFAFGLLLGAAGRLWAKGQSLTIDRLCSEAGCFVSGLVRSELKERVKTANSAGEYIYHRYGLTGARGEAESGFVSARQWALPAYQRATEAGFDPQSALLSALVALMANNADTNLVARGGIEGLNFVKDEARQLTPLALCGPVAFKAQLQLMDDRLIARNLSPGGSADLLAVTWFLSQLTSSTNNGS